MTALPDQALLFFPVQADPAQAAAYARRYLLQIAEPEAPSGVQADEAAVLARVKRAADMPSTLDAESGLLALPPTQQEVLAQKQRIFMLYWRRVCPLLEGETLLTERVTFTAEAWAGFPAHILLYERRTDQGELALLLPYVHMNPQTGQLDYAGKMEGVLPALVRPSNEALLGSSADGFDIAQSVLGMITWVGMGCGPAGMVVAAGAGIIEIILGLVRPKGDPVNLPKVVDQVLKRDLAEDHVLHHATTILTYIDWLSEQNKEALQGTMSGIDPAKYKDALAQLKQYVTNACDPSSPLLQAIGDLKNGGYSIDPSFQILALPVFLLERARIYSWRSAASSS